LVAHVHDKLLMVYLNDNTRARILRPDGAYARAHPTDGATPVDSQAIFATGQGAPPDDVPRYTHVPTQP
jgi:hypothetical protein